MNIMQYLDIIIFAVIAVVLLMRLRGVLGERDEDDVPGFEIKPTATPDRAAERAAAATENTGALAAHNNTAPSASNWSHDLPNYNWVDTATAHSRLGQFVAIDPSFRPDAFLDKAQKAFAMIVRAYSEGSLNTLEFLLGKDLYATFAAQIEKRQTEGETFFIHLHGVQKAVIVDAQLDGTLAHVWVDFTAEQAITHKDAEGRVQDDKSGSRRITKDRWVFTKDLKDTSPIWLLTQIVASDD